MDLFPNPNPNPSDRFPNPPSVQLSRGLGFNSRVVGTRLQAKFCGSSQSEAALPWPRPPKFAEENSERDPLEKAEAQVFKESSCDSQTSP